jgi:hypothetical protein
MSWFCKIPFAGPSNASVGAFASGGKVDKNGRLPDAKLKAREREMRFFTLYDLQCGAFPSRFSPRQRLRRS